MPSEPAAVPATSARRRWRWAAPAVAAVTIAAVASSSGLASAGPPDLPERTAAELLAGLADADPTALSGTVVQTARLGLPELPAGTGGTDPLALLSGSHTLRVWADGPERLRLALLGDLAEYDVVRSAGDVWTYSSEQDEAVHYVLPPGAADERPVVPLGPGTPAEAADALLAAIDPTTTVRVEDNVEIAGRAAYQLVLEPRDPGSLVGSVRVALDAEEQVPLRVQVWSTNDPAVPAFEVGFTDVSFGAPDPSVFDFVAPPGADVREVPVPGPAADGTPDVSSDGAAPAGVEVTGRGWSSVVELTPAQAPALDPEAQDAQGGQSALLDQLSTSVPEGRLFTSALVTVLLTDDGRVLAGAVPGQALQDAAQR